MTDLTDDFKNLKLKEGQKYFCKTPTGIDVFEFEICRDDLNNVWCYLENQRYCYNNVYHSDEIEVLAPCDYEELQQLKEENKSLIKEYQAKQIDITNLFNENEQLRQLLYSLKCCLTSETIDTQVRIDKALAKINEVLK